MEKFYFLDLEVYSEISVDSLSSDELNVHPGLIWSVL